MSKRHRRRRSRPAEFSPEFELFCGACAGAITEYGPEDDKIAGMFMTEDGPDGLDEGIVVMGFGGEMDMDEVNARVDEIFVGGRHYAALANRLRWTPRPDEESTEAWFFVAVAPAENARFFVKRTVEDDTWWDLPKEAVPWFAFSTAGALRHKLMGESAPLMLRHGKDPRLLRSPMDTPPPIGPDGLI